MDVQQLYEPDPEALERVVEILYRVLVEASDCPGKPDGSLSIEAPDPTCLSPEHEG